jgi:hypothetical protein
MRDRAAVLLAGALCALLCYGFCFLLFSLGGF